MLSFACPSFVTASFVTARIRFFDAHQSGMVTNWFSAAANQPFGIWVFFPRRASENAPR